MQLDYQKILNDCGFNEIPDPENTTLAFYHEINNTLFDDDSPFDMKQSMVVELPNNLNYMVQCSLPLKPGVPIKDGVRYLISKWYECLAYCNPKFEDIQRTSSVFGTEVRIFTVAGNAACSFLFSITDEAAQEFENEFTDSYAPVDDPDSILEKLQH